MDNSFQEIIDQLSEEVSSKETSLCIGTFDGVHRGHQKLFKELVKISKINNLLSIVLVFELRPREIINPSLSKPYIIPFEERIQNIKSQKVDKTIKLNFDNNIRNISAKKFLEILKNKINLTSLVVSEDTRIGNDQKDGNDLKKICEELKISFNSIKMSSDDNKIVSSSSVSTHISNGEIDKANSMLGRTFRISGKVESGDKLGRTIGIPTANLAVSKDLIIPGDGIYAVKVHVNNQIYKGALSIGNRPVIKADDSRKIEVYIIDFNKNIYGELIEISIISKIRNQENYGSLEELRFQIDKDIVQITNILENA
ncbi:MAG: bifunctional riboflavin kinase/FAD synthetase [Dehalococcoidia bacterium]|jgi:riboflavin kinase/FMN adenylyltransferase|nr:bifunctional riboflavin kinase/FAD synthetase [Dehalococcoidia bacterium]|tara:strand:+ start:5948 stop:6886 length:939 start_codon:yes stop_codon:yes gene_type:complete